jgi:hypothetical protein
MLSRRLPMKEACELELEKRYFGRGRFKGHTR